MYVETGNTLPIYVNGVEVASGPYSGSYVGFAVGYLKQRFDFGHQPVGLSAGGDADKVGCWQRK